MAVEFKVDHERSSEYRFAPENITINPELNGRHEKPDVEWLIADILRTGQHTCVQVRNDGGEAVLVAGFSRWRAVSEINRRKLTPKPLKLRATYVRVNEVTAFLMNISENRFRNETTPIDDAHNIQRLLNVYQMSEKQIAEVYFPTAATGEETKRAIKFVKDRVALITLTPEAEEAVKTGRVKESAAAAIAKLSASQQREVLLKDGAITGKDVKAAKPAKAKKPKPPEPEFMRRVTAVVQSVDWSKVAEDESTVEVDAITLIALRDYVEELQAAK